MFDHVKFGRQRLCSEQSVPWKNAAMCRKIKTLFNFEPPASEAEIRDASLHP